MLISYNFAIDEIGSFSWWDMLHFDEMMMIMSNLYYARSLKTTVRRQIHVCRSARTHYPDSEPLSL